MDTVFGDIPLPECECDCTELSDCVCLGACEVRSLQKEYCQIGNSKFDDISDGEHAMFVDTTAKMKCGDSWVYDLLLRQSNAIRQSDAMRGSRRRPNRPKAEQIAEWAAISDTIPQLVTTLSGFMREHQSIADAVRMLGEIYTADKMPDEMLFWVLSATEFAADRMATLRASYLTTLLTEPKDTDPLSARSIRIKKVQEAIRTHQTTQETSNEAQLIGENFAKTYDAYTEILTNYGMFLDDEAGESGPTMQLEVVENSHDVCDAARLTDMFITQSAATITIKLVKRRSTIITTPVTKLPPTAICNVAISRVDEKTVVVQRMEPLAVARDTVSKIVSCPGIGYYKGPVYEMFVEILTGIQPGISEYYDVGYFYTGDVGNPPKSKEDIAYDAIYNTTGSFAHMLVVTASGQLVQINDVQSYVHVSFVQQVVLSRPMPENRHMRIHQANVDHLKIKLPLYRNADALAIKSSTSGIAFDACNTLKYLLISCTDHLIRIPSCTLPNLQTFILTGDGKYDATVPAFVSRQPKLSIAWIDTLPAPGVECRQLSRANSPLLDTLLLSVCSSTYKGVMSTIKSLRSIRRLGIYFGREKYPTAGDARMEIIRSIPNTVCQFRYARPFTGELDSTMSTALGNIGYPSNMVCIQAPPTNENTGARTMDARNIRRIRTVWRRKGHTHRTCDRQTCSIARKCIRIRGNRCCRRNGHLSSNQTHANRHPRTRPDGHV